MGRAACATEVMLLLARLVKRTFRCQFALSYAVADGVKLHPAGCCGLSPFAIRVFLQHSLQLHSLSLLQEVALHRRRLVLPSPVPSGLLPAAVAGLFPPGAVVVMPVQVADRLLGAVFAVRDTRISKREMVLLGWTVRQAALALTSLAGSEALTLGGRRDLFDLEDSTRLC